MGREIIKRDTLQELRTKIKTPGIVVSVIVGVLGIHYGNGNVAHSLTGNKLILQTVQAVDNHAVPVFINRKVVFLFSYTSCLLCVCIVAGAYQNNEHALA